MQRNLAICFIIAVGSIGCKATAGAGAIRAKQISTEIDAIRAAIDNSTLLEAEKLIIKKKLNTIDRTAAGLGRDVDTNKEIADKNATDAARWRGLVWVLISIAIVLTAIIVRHAIKRLVTA